MSLPINDAPTREQFELVVKHTFIQAQSRNVTLRRTKSDPAISCDAQGAAPTEFLLQALHRDGTPICSTLPSRSSVNGDEVGETDSMDANAFGSSRSDTNSLDLGDSFSGSPGSMPHGRPVPSHTSTTCPSEADCTKPEDDTMPIRRASWPYASTTHVDDSAWAWPTTLQGTLQDARESSHHTMVRGITSNVLSTASEMQYDGPFCSNTSELLSTASPQIQTSPRGSGTTDDEEIGFSCFGAAVAGEARTTVMVRNINDRLTQVDLVQRINEMGHQGLYDFVYMPMNFRDEVNFRYAFVNFRSPALALNFASQACSIEQDSADDSRRWQTSWSACQDLQSNVERYRNSPLMHEMIPDDCKPTMFDESGRRIPFPPPTKVIRKPKIHRLRPSKLKDGESRHEPSTKAKKDDGHRAEEHQTVLHKESTQVYYHKTGLAFANGSPEYAIQAQDTLMLGGRVAQPR